MSAINASIGCAVVGYGLAGQAFHAPLIAATPGLTLRTIVSSRPEAVHVDWPEVAVTENLTAVLDDPDIALIVIATPDALHAEQAQAALVTGKHVVIDKPVVRTLTEAHQIAAVAERSPGICTVFQNRRWDSDFLTLSKLIAAGELGDVVTFESHYDRFRPVVIDRWKEKPDAGVWQDLGRLPRETRFIGDMPHAWISSDYIRSALDLFYYERSSDRALILAAGIAPSWLTGGGIAIRDIRTPYGRLSYALRPSGRTLRLTLSGAARPPGGFILPWPYASRAPAWAMIDGRTARLHDNLLAIPASARSVVLRRP